jgi:hypothetical protein
MLGSLRSRPGDPEQIAIAGSALGRGSTLGK